VLLRVSLDALGRSLGRDTPTHVSSDVIVLGDSERLGSSDLIAFNVLLIPVSAEAARRIAQR
jgi:hypothetical protein